MKRSMEKKSQSQQVLDALVELGGTATLKELYKAVDTSAWATKTPEASIRRIVQNSKAIAKVKPGVWSVK